MKKIIWELKILKDEKNIKFYNLIKKLPEILILKYINYKIKKINLKKIKNNYLIEDVSSFKSNKFNVEQFYIFRIYFPINYYMLNKYKDNLTIKPQLDKTVNFMLEKLNYVGADAIILPKDFYIYFKINIENLEKTGLSSFIFPFFLHKAILKSLYLKNKNLKNAEILIIEDNINICLAVIKLLSKEVNCLNIIAKPNNIEILKNYAEEITEETGLTIGVFEKNITLSNSADVILNLTEEAEKNFNQFKRDVIIFYIGNGKICEPQKYYNSLIFKEKNSKVFFVDNLLLQVDEEVLTLEKLDSILMCTNKYYKNYKCHNKNNFEFILNNLEYIKIKNLLNSYIKIQ